ncbi:MAG: bifunctional 2-C-methyl-D-erythritol 4-phosphate cytidylyltransferase/2-C-methyl-D-erythritol 2,4-cyclodiphosphate synthase [Rhodospirillaceae bacterium]|nr:bifunctional 2-C-methyl-D-erythritol 4-phosphate cytidylyltransferase/2-C-methyl-D-erythritol 2,4-cyclodiphosphate synthase [Rhodospirillaceae bacterium]
MSGCYALLVAAGRGSRLPGDVPKQYRRIGGEPILRRSARAFLGHSAIAGVRVVIHADDRRLYDEATAGLDLLPPVHGGATRQDSVRNGIESLAELTPDHVMIHDAARPFVGAATIAAARDSLDTAAGAIVAIPVVDSLKRVEGGRMSAVDRKDLWRAQTPQAFRYAAIREAHRAAAGRDLTDDAAVAEAAGLALAIAPGHEDNFKITTEDDILRAERMLARPLYPRTGMGFDVHAFGPGDHMWLCGLRIPHSHGLVGHSDADVGLHALTDAVLGAIADGDIGAHFSDRDPRWKGAPSELFLKHAVELVQARGGRVLHLDLTLICEQPRIRPHHAAMVARVAAIAGLDAKRVSIKATTTEQLGFTGRREGIAGQAVATVLLPDE